MNKRPFIDWNDAILIAALREAEEDSTPDWYRARRNGFYPDPH